jgi:hypothetical protein
MILTYENNHEIILAHFFNVIHHILTARIQNLNLKSNLYTEKQKRKILYG